MDTRRHALTGLFTLALLASCSNGEPTPAVDVGTCVDDLVLSVDAIPEAPSDTYRLACANCHGATGEGRGDYPSLADVQDFDTFSRAVWAGSDAGMPAFDPSEVTPEILAYDLAFLTGRSVEATLTCETLASYTQDDGPVDVGELDDDAVFARGLEAWRAPHPKGGCVGCHAPDAYDLAFFDYRDAEIMRRALGQQASVEDAQAIIDLVHLQRRRHNLTPVNSDTYRFLQPCGEMLPGDTELQRERAFIEQLDDLGHPYLGARITTPAAAEAALQDVTAWDLRDVCVGFPFPRWTADQFRGREFHSLNDWIPEFATMPAEGMETDWFALHDAYIDDPSDENLWAILHATEDDDALVERIYHDVSDEAWADAATITNSFTRFKYHSMLAGSHMMRHGTDSRPDPGWDQLIEDDIVGGGNGEPLGSWWFTTQDRVSYNWDVAENMGSSGQPATPFGLWPEFIADKSYGYDRHQQDDLRSPFALSWFYLGWMYDPALNFTAKGNRQEYFPQHFRSEDLDGYPLHLAFTQSMAWAHAQYGRNERLSIYTRLQQPYANGQIVHDLDGGMSGMGHKFNRHAWFNGNDAYPEDLAELYRTFVINDYRARVFALEASLLRGDTTGNLEGTLDTFTEFRNVLLTYELPEHLDTLTADLDRIQALLETAGGPADSTAGTANNSHVHRTSSIHERRDLFLPDHQYDARPQSPFGPVYAEQCAACHGQIGQGHTGGGEAAGHFDTFQGYPRLRQYGSWAGFEAYVRTGIHSDIVEMPAFPPDRISDAELRAMWEALNDPETLAQDGE